MYKFRQLPTRPFRNTAPFSKPADKLLSKFLIMDNPDIIFGKQL